MRTCEIGRITKSEHCDSPAVWFISAYQPLGLFVCQVHGEEFPQHLREPVPEEEAMPVIVKDNRKEFTPAPEGLHQAVCVDVIDKGMEETPWGPKQKIELRWQVDQVNQETGKPFLVVKKYTASLNEKAQLCKDLEAWRGKKFTKTERDGFDVEKLLGVNCQLQIVHHIAENGNTYANVQAVVPLGKGMAKIAAKDYVRLKDREANDGNGHTPPADDDDIPF